MERDRELSLLRQAHFEGYLDCKEARLSDRKWWRKAHWAMDWAEKRNRNELRRLFHEHNASMLDYFTGEKAMDLHWEQAVQIQNRYAKAILPWEKVGKQLFSRRRFDEMVALWEAVWGKRSDPEVQQRIQWTAEQLNAIAAKAVNGGQHGGAKY